MAAGGNLELPHGRDGKLDYDTLGKMVTAHILGEVLHATFVDPKHRRKPCDTSIKADTDWEYCYEKSNVTVLRKKSHHTCFMGRGVVNKPLKDLAEFYEDIQSTFIWDPLLVDARYVRQLSNSNSHTDYIGTTHTFRSQNNSRSTSLCMSLGYQMFETKQYCGLISLKRDMLYYVRCIYTGDGKYIQSGVSVEDPEFPLQSGVPRVDLHFGSGFVLEPYGGGDNQTLISYLADIDVKQLPSLIMKQVLKCHPMSIQNVRKYFSNFPSKVRSSRARSTPEHHKCQSSKSTYSASASLSPLKHSSTFYEEGAITKDFLGFDQTRSSTVRHSSTPLSIHSEPLCFSTVHELHKNDL